MTLILNCYAPVICIHAPTPGVGGGNSLASDFLIFKSPAKSPAQRGQANNVEQQLRVVLMLL